MGRVVDAPVSLIEGWLCRNLILYALRLYRTSKPSDGSGRLFISWWQTLRNVNDCDAGGPLHKGRPGNRYLHNLFHRFLGALDLGQTELILLGPDFFLWCLATQSFIHILPNGRLHLRKVNFSHRLLTLQVVAHFVNLGQR